MKQAPGRPDEKRSHANKNRKSNLPSANHTDTRKRSPYDLLLGRRLESKSHNVGFHTAQPPSRSDELITHSSEGNLVTIGKTGSGKGRSALIPNLGTYRGSTIVLDLKGELYRTTARARREMGQKVFLLDPFNQISLDPDGSMSLTCCQ